MKEKKLPVPDSELRRIGSLTALMRQKEAELTELQRTRYAEVSRLAMGDETHQRVSYARLADAMGLSEVAVYKVLRRNGPPLRERRKTGV
jgi:hypothetical protein